MLRAIETMDAEETARWVAAMHRAEPRGIPQARPPEAARHGTSYSYDYHLCRCRPCVVGYRARRRERYRRSSTVN